MQVEAECQTLNGTGFNITVCSTDVEQVLNSTTYNLTLSSDKVFNFSIGGADTIYPSVNLTSPTNASRQVGNNVTVNVTMTDINPDTCILEWNGINESFGFNTSDTLYWSYMNTIDGINYSLNVYCCDKIGNWNNSGIIHFLENNVTTVSSVSVSVPYSNVDANCSYTSSPDSDGDTLDTYYIWFVNGIYKETNINISLLDDSKFIQSDNVACVVKLFDSYENTTPLNSSSISGTATTGLGGPSGVPSVTKPTNITVLPTFSFNLASAETPFISGTLDQPNTIYSITVYNISYGIIHINNFSTDVNNAFIYKLPFLNLPSTYTTSINNSFNETISVAKVVIISDLGRVFWRLNPNILSMELASRVCALSRVSVVGDRPWNYTYIPNTLLSSDVLINRVGDILKVCVDSDQLEPGEVTYEFISISSSYGEKILAVEVSRKPCPTIEGFGNQYVSVFNQKICVLHFLVYVATLLISCIALTTYRTERFRELKLNHKRFLIFFTVVAVTIILLTSGVVGIDLDNFASWINDFFLGIHEI